MYIIIRDHEHIVSNTYTRKGIYAFTPIPFDYECDNNYKLTIEEKIEIYQKNIKNGFTDQKLKLLKLIDDQEK